MRGKDGLGCAEEASDPVDGGQPGPHPHRRRTSGLIHVRRRISGQSVLDITFVSCQEVQNRGVMIPELELNS